MEVTAAGHSVNIFESNSLMSIDLMFGHIVLDSGIKKDL